MIIIEPFEPKYLNDVSEIEKLCFDRPWSKEDLKRQLTLETSHFKVAVDGEKAVGYMGLQIFSGGGYVTDIAVLPQYRRRGIARMLINEQLKNKMDFITLEVRKSNFAAIALYESCGFKSIGVRPRFYSSPDEDALIMTKETLTSDENTCN